MIAIDTNLLVYAHRSAAPEHRAARSAIERAANAETGWGVSHPSIAEFWSVVTHASLARPSTAGEASSFLRSVLRDGSGQLWLPGSGFGERLLRLATDLKVRGPRIFDLQIALTAIEHGAREMWTHDRQFVSVPGLRVRDPLSDAR